MSYDPTRAFARQQQRKTIGEALAPLGLYLLLMVPFVLWNGFVLTELWAWFAAPLGAPTLTLGPAIGLNLLITFLIVQTPEQEPDKGYMTRAISFAITEPAIALLVGWIIHLVIS